MSLSTIKRLLFTHRQPPSGYDSSWLRTEFGNVERALSDVRTITIRVIGITSYTVGNFDAFYRVDASSGAVTMNMPQSPVPGCVRVTIMKDDPSANAVTIHAAVNATINDPTLTAQYASMTLISDGVAWWKIAST